MIRASVLADVLYCCLPKENKRYMYVAILLINSFQILNDDIDGLQDIHIAKGQRKNGQLQVFFSKCYKKVEVIGLYSEIVRNKQKILGARPKILHKYFIRSELSCRHTRDGQNFWSDFVEVKRFTAF